jgi:hypothetical protein
MPSCLPPPQALASRGATLFMLCRNQQRGQEAVQAVREQTGNKDVQLAVRRLTCRHQKSTCSCACLKELLYRLNCWLALATWCRLYGVVHADRLFVPVCLYVTAGRCVT